ncbi:MAG: right-handed parallel beta-helix repeat-containing protein [Acidobacteria bacterium]|nr:right-handed parallel beta-helix repeat-containing protein [Acidobacteriota bacterium]
MPPILTAFLINNSGGSIDPFSGLYTAGENAGVADTIRVTDSFGESTDATVNTFGAADRIVFTVQPTNTTAGENISAIQVTVQDQLGNTVTNSTASITLSIANNPNSGTLGGTATKNAVNGVATFSDLSINRAGVGYTLQAASGGLASATSNAFDINVGAATQIAFTVQPTDTSPTATIAPPVQVTILDALGNTVSTATDPITLAIGNNPNSGTLSGNLIRNAVNGIAIFDDLSIDNPGVGYTLNASSGGLTGAASDSFNVSNPFEVTNTNDSGTGSLRQSILNANATAGQQTITFNIPGSAPFIISPTSAMPDITDSVILDATTQTGFSGSPIVVLTGTNIPAGNGITLRTGNNTVKGFVIGGFSGGIVIPSGNNGNTIQTNYIGTVSNGLGANPNDVGIAIFGSSNNVIGGNSPAERNLISGNRDQGVLLTTAGFGNNQIRGNYIGTNANGTSAIPNRQGISVRTSDNTIAGNLISGNTLEGIALIAATASPEQPNQIQGNLIGTRADGLTALPNGVGILIKRSQTNIGGVAMNEANTIAFNTGRGILGQGGPFINNTIRGNSIHSNGGRDIDFGGTSNDPNDPDLGFNKQQNYPVLTSSVSSTGNTQIKGSLSSAPSQNFTLDFYSNPACDASGFGAGQTYLGSANVSTDAGGLKGFTANLPLAVTPGSFVSSTATDADGNTSEFSACQLTSSGVVTISGTMLDTNGDPIPNAFFL